MSERRGGCRATGRRAREGATSHAFLAISIPRAELAPGGQTGVAFRHAFRDELSGERVEVELQFRIEIGFLLAAAKQAVQLGAHPT